MCYFQLLTTLILALLCRIVYGSKACDLQSTIQIIGDFANYTQKIYPNEWFVIPLPSGILDLNFTGAGATFVVEELLSNRVVFERTYIMGNFFKLKPPLPHIS
jgi:hypothetical protein